MVSNDDDTAQDPEKDSPAEPKSQAHYYVKPAELKAEMADWKHTGVMSERLGEMFTAIATNMSFKKNFINYTWRDDMIQKGVLHLCMYARSFDPAHPRSNAFGYCSKIVYNAFIQFIKKQKRHSKLKKDLLDRAYSTRHLLAQVDRVGSVRFDDEENIGWNQ